MTPTEFITRWKKFITRWKKSSGAEITNEQSFAKELCELLELPHPDPTQPDEAANVYTFQKAVQIPNGDGTSSDGRIDLYRRGCFVLESKQGTERQEAEEQQALAETSKAEKFRKGHGERGTAQWSTVMTRARKQAEQYAKALDEWAPFLIVVDVGYCIQLYPDFTQQGKNYQPFPDPQSYAIPLKELERGHL